MITVKYDLRRFECIYLDLGISITDRCAYAYECSRTKRTKYIKKDVVNNYIAVSINGSYCMVFTDDFKIDEDKIKSVSINKYISGREEFMEHITLIHNQEIMELESKIEYYKSKLK